MKKSSLEIIKISHKIRTNKPNKKVVMYNEKYSTLWKDLKKKAEQIETSILLNIHSHKILCI